MQYKYRFEIETITPVHIGTGEVYEPTNFVIDDGYLYEFDETLFVKSLPLVEKNAFNRMVVGEDYFQIISFYKNHVEYAKKIAFNKTAVSKKVEETYKKSLNKDGTRNKNQLEIQKTYKNPNTHMTVIPGSSIKGMLDTVFGIYTPKVKENEPRQKLKVADALMFDGASQIAYSYRRHKDPNKAARNPIPQIVEVISKNSKFIVTIETSLKFDEILEKFRSYYEQTDRRSAFFDTTKNSFSARIGKFSGKPYMVDDGENVRNSYGKSVATHTLFEDNSPFGWVVFRHINEEEFRQKLHNVEERNQAYFDELNQRQKKVLEKIQKQKEEAKKAKAEKEARLLAEQKVKEEEERKKQEALASMSPFERQLQTIFEKDPNTPKTTLLLKAIENGEIEQKCEALEYLKKLMIENKEWKESTSAKKPQKDKPYQKTLKVLKLIEECNK